MTEKIKIKYKVSAIGSLAKHKLSLKGLGLRKLNQIVELNATPEVLGMVKKVSHLIEIMR
ncbi:MAG: 50S ribosomal protein L30 [Proteobacteria bacterium]|nr:50S ribosomal protein L30 [Pseudomonadota bacterium]